MMKLKEKSTNKKILLNVSGVDKATRRGLRQGLFQFGRDLKRTFDKQVLKKPKSGRLYRIRRGATTRTHRASAPGESPANLSGAYRRSAGFKINGSFNMAWGAGSADVSYAVMLENGTSRMEPRPGLGNAVKATERNAINYLQNNIRRNMT